MSAAHISPYRRGFIYLLFVAVAGGLGWRMLDLQVLNPGFLKNQGDARHQRVVKMPAYRGIIADRNGEPLALSAPVDSIWAVPHETLLHPARFKDLAKAIGISEKGLKRRLKGGGREFVYLRRHMIPDRAAKVADLKVPGVYRQREYRRYYPAGEVAGHLVGFTDVDNAGQEGLELALDDRLRGQPGKRRVVRDRYGHVIESTGVIEAPRSGQDLRLSIDRRIQYIAYRELKRAVIERGA
ncbi:MAG: penicillin-binding protein 2, partial [Gammaproteobacteria bacterium]